MNTLHTTTAFIPEFRLEDLEIQISKMNRRAAKLGVAPITLTLTGREDIRDFTETTSGWDGEGDTVRTFPVRAVEVTVTGESPVLSGWEFAASIDAVESGVNVLHCLPSFDVALPVRFRSATSQCDHCKQERKRNNTFVLHNRGTGEFTQIGRQCLRDFLGHADIHGITDAAAYMEQFNRLCEGGFEGEAGGRAKPLYNVRKIVTMAFNYVRTRPYISRQVASERGCCSTSEVVGSMLADDQRRGFLTRERSDYIDSMLTLIGDDAAYVDDLLEWGASLPLNDPLQYVANLAALLRCEWVGARNVGLVISSVVAYAKHLGRLTESSAKCNEHVGALGEKLTLAVKLVRMMEFDTHFGKMTVHIFEDNVGRCFKWGTSSSPFCEEDVNQLFLIRGTVKAHTEYNGRRQTELLRVKIIPCPAGK